MYLKMAKKSLNKVILQDSDLESEAKITSENLDPLYGDATLKRVTTNILPRCVVRRVQLKELDVYLCFPRPSPSC